MLHLLGSNERGKLRKCKEELPLGCNCLMCEVLGAHCDLDEPHPWLAAPVPRVREHAFALCMNVCAWRLRDGDPDGLMAANPDAYYFFEERTGTPMLVVPLSCWMLCLVSSCTSCRRCLQSISVVWRQLGGRLVCSGGSACQELASLPQTADASSVWQTDAFDERRQGCQKSPVLATFDFRSSQVVGWDVGVHQSAITCLSLPDS